MQKLDKFSLPGNIIVMKLSSSKIYYIFLLPVLSGIILGISALPSKLFFLNFLALIPLLFAASWTKKYKNYFIYFIIQLTIFFVTFYIWVGSWVLETANLGFLIGLVVVIPFILLLAPYILLLKSGSKFAPLYFISSWLFVELIQSISQIGLPFYNLGHSLGVKPQIIQWYSLTGTSGGTLWILTVNFCFLNLVQKIFIYRQKWVNSLLKLSVIILLPLLVSVLIFINYKEKGTVSEVLVVHPSVDNYKEKYKMNIYELMDIYLDILKPNLTDKTEFAVLPETAITNAGWISEFNNNLVFQHFREKTTGFPTLKLITGVVAYEAIADVRKIKNHQKIPGIRYSENYKTWYYTYNAAVQAGHNQTTQIRVKEGLVPYQEFAPFPTVLPYISPVGIDFQFSKKEDNQDIFITETGVKTAALICYEVVFSRLFRRVARHGAGAFFVLLNEGWYNDPKVPKQFIQLSAIRAIENRKYVAHSSNMGISAFFNQKGETIKMISEKKPGFIKQQIVLNQKQTFYTANGDIIGFTAVIASIIQLLAMGIKNLQYYIHQGKTNER